MPPHGMAVTGTDCTQMPGIRCTFIGYSSMITSSIRVAYWNSQFRGTHKFLRMHHVFEETLLLTVSSGAGQSQQHARRGYNNFWSQSPPPGLLPIRIHHFLRTLQIKVNSNSNVSSNTWYIRKNLCVPRNWEFQYATRILDVIMLEYPMKVHPIPGIWVQSVPVTAIPWGGMNTDQRNILQRSIQQDD